MSKELLNIKCRTCFNTTKGLKSLATISTDNKCYAELLEEITNISIMEHGELPKLICGYCSKRLKSAHAFVQQVKDVNEKFLSMLKEKDNLKQELDCLQETQIDIQSCLKIEQEYDEEECKNDKLDCFVKVGADADCLKDDVVINNKLQLLETNSELACKTQNDNDREEFKNVEKDDTIVLEDFNNAEFEEIKEKLDSELNDADQSDDDVESLHKSDTQDQAENTGDVKEKEKLEKKSKMIRFSSQDNQNGNDVAVPCNKCNKIFLNSKALRVHQRISHIPEERKCTCNLCGSKFTRYCNMYKHMRTFHGPDSVTLMRKPAEGENIYECNKCPKKYSRKKSLSYHIKTKHVTSPEVKNNTESNLRKTKTKAADKGSLCPICGSSFTSKTQLTVHIRRHTGERPFKCDLCDRAFLLVTQLNSHKRVHTGEKPYKCQLCAKAFRVSDHLRQHMRSHTDDRPFKCSQCERSFKYSQDLSKHLRSNRSERPYGRICDNSLPRCNKTWRRNCFKTDTTKNVKNQDV